MGAGIDDQVIRDAQFDDNPLVVVLDFYRNFFHTSSRGDPYSFMCSLWNINIFIRVISFSWVVGSLFSGDS